MFNVLCINFTHILIICVIVSLSSGKRSKSRGFTALMYKIYGLTVVGWSNIIIVKNVVLVSLSKVILNTINGR